MRRQLLSSQRTHHYHDQGNHSNSLDSNAGHDTELGKATLFTRKQVRYTSSQSAEAKNQAETRSEETPEDDCNKGWDISARGQEDELAADRGNTGTIYIHIQVPGEGDQGGG